MQTISRVLCVALALVPANAVDSPVAKVISMLSDLQSKIIEEGETAQKNYAKYAEWCEDRASNLGYEIKTGDSEVDSLKAGISQDMANVETLQTKVEELAASIATDEADLKAATEIRNMEASDFAAEEKELMETIDMLHRATSILEREMAKGGAAMVQLKNVGSLAQAFSVMVQASLISSSDATKLNSFIQDAQKSKEGADDLEDGAPSASVYDSHSGDIVQVMEDLSEKAETQLAETRTKETSNLHNFEMLKQSLVDEVKFANSEMGEAKQGIAKSTESKSTGEGDLGVTSKELKEDIKTKEDLHHDCMEKATSFQAEVKSRGEELRALADAKKVIQEATGVSLSQLSFLQVTRSKLSSSTDLAKLELVRFVRDLARKQHSGSLAQLASRMASAMESRDPFEKVKGLISDMISKLEDEAGADATKKAYCDKELAETNEKKADKTAEIEKASTRITKMSSKSAQLKEEVATLQNDLSKLAKSQANMDKMRGDEHAAFLESKAELEKGLSGIKLALKILTEYYASDGKAHSSAEGAGAGIIGLLEVVEADFSKNLAQVMSDEDMAVSEYEQLSKENEIEKVTKDQSVKYKTKESKGLDQTSAEITSDRLGVQAELDAVLEYLAQIERECIAKAETYEARTEHRQADRKSVV